MNSAPAFTFLVPGFVLLRVATDAKRYPRGSLIPRTGAHEFLEKCSSDSVTFFKKFLFKHNYMRAR